LSILSFIYYFFPPVPKQGRQLASDIIRTFLFFPLQNQFNLTLPNPTSLYYLGQ
jgi:hypothetical protein